VLTDDERYKFQQWARRPKISQRLALRARIVLGCADGLQNRRVALQLRITDQTVCNGENGFGKLVWSGGRSHSSHTVWKRSSSPLILSS
jgi:hypothetical protein